MLYCIKHDGEDSGTQPGFEGIDFSFEEQWTGKRWVDGKKIYQKTVDCGRLPANSRKNTNHEIASIDDIIDYSGEVKIVKPSIIEYAFLPNVSVAGVSSNIAYYCTNSIIGIQTFSTGWNSFDTQAFITLQYTCTDR